MKLRAFFTTLVLTGVTLGAVSCADLLDADRCYRWARLYCDKSCADDRDKCTDELRHACYNADTDAEELDACADKLDAIEDCGGVDNLPGNCAGDFSYDSSSTYKKLGDACSASYECRESCTYGVCTKFCSSDSDCLGSSQAGVKNVCNTEENQCRPSCSTSSSCKGELSCQTIAGKKVCAPDDSNPGGTPTGKARQGDPCTSFSDCDSNLSTSCREGYCTDNCTSNLDCGSTNSDGYITFCVKPSSGANLCLPSCDVSSDCASGDSCSQLATVGGGGQRICSSDSPVPIPGTKQVGASCTSASECMGPSPLCAGYCTRSCEFQSDCPTASNGMPSYCANTGMAKVCMPTCNSSANCMGASCQSVPGSQGGSANVCYPSSVPLQQHSVGDACNDATGCGGTLECFGGMCTAKCDARTPCPIGANQTVCFDSLCTIDCSDTDCPGSYQCTYQAAFERDICTPF